MKELLELNKMMTENTLLINSLSVEGNNIDVTYTCGHNIHAKNALGIGSR